MKTTRYFDEQVLRKRPEITLELVENALKNIVEQQEQPDGRWRMWAFVPQAGKYLRVVLLEDRQTILNAFFDRNYRGTP